MVEIGLTYLPKSKPPPPAPTALLRTHERKSYYFKKVSLVIIVLNVAFQVPNKLSMAYYVLLRKDFCNFKFNRLKSAKSTTIAVEDFF